MSRDLVAEHVGRPGRPRPDGRDPKVVVTRLQIGSRKERGKDDPGVERSPGERDGHRGRLWDDIAAVGDQLNLDRLVALQHRAIVAPVAAGEPDAALRLVDRAGALGAEPSGLRTVTVGSALQVAFVGVDTGSGATVGVGCAEGITVGDGLGACVGSGAGSVVGSGSGPAVGSGVGCAVGAVVGSTLGSSDGSAVGSGEGGLMTSGLCLTKENMPVVALTVPLV